MEHLVPKWISDMAKRVSRQHLEGIAATSAVLISCFLIYKKRGTKRGTFHRSITLGALHGGRLAMQRILDAQHARVDASVLDGAEAQLSHLLGVKPLDFIRLQVGRLEHSIAAQTHTLFFFFFCMLKSM